MPGQEDVEPLLRPALAVQILHLLTQVLKGGKDIFHDRERVQTASNFRVIGIGCRYRDHNCSDLFLRYSGTALILLRNQPLHEVLGVIYRSDKISMEEWIVSYAYNNCVITLLHYPSPFVRI